MKVSQGAAGVSAHSVPIASRRYADMYDAEVLAAESQFQRNLGTGLPDAYPSSVERSID